MATNTKNLSKRDQAIINQLVVGAFAVGIIISLFIIFIASSTISIEDSTKNKFILMHQEYPLVYFAWLIPILIAILGHFLAKIFIQKKNEFDNIMENKDAIITNNALFAKSIGEGDFDNSDFGTLNKDDLLTKSLIMMRRNLQKNKEKEHISIWINNGKELISEQLRKTTDLDELSEKVLVTLLDYCEIIQGRFFIWNNEKNAYKLSSAYAYNRKKYIHQEFKVGEGLIGASAYEQLPIYRTEIPSEYTTITSGIITDKKPGSLFIMPLISENKVQGIIEVANIDDNIEKHKRDLIETLGPIIAQVLFSVSVNKNTERLLNESQALTEELRENEEELQQNAEEMLVTHEELEKTNEELELQINEVEVSKKRLHSLLENASEVISIFDSKGNVKYESPSMETIFGYAPDALIGTKGLNRVVKEFIPLALEKFKYLINNPHKSVNYSYKHYKNDGSEVWVETTGRNMLENPAVKGLIFNTRDITLDRLAEKDRRIKSQMQALSENSPDLIIRFSKTGKIHYANPKVKNYLGIDKEEIQGFLFKDTSLNNDFKKLFSERIELTIKDNKKLETEFSTKINNNTTVFKISTIPEYNEEKELETILLVAHDLTEIKAIEQEITEKNLKLNDSINYAQRIQTAILPTNDLLKKHFTDSFIFYKARDVVSGDYPWLKVNENGIYLAAVDCTGHGVPGALLSFIGYFLLNNIVNSNPKSNSAVLLDTFDMDVKRTLKQENGSKNTRDGMDIALCKFSLDGKSLSFSGAHRPLYIIRNNELIQYKGDRRPIGGVSHKKKKIKEFTNHKIDLLKGDKLFIFSDGLSDQFKEKTFEKFQEKQVRQLFKETSQLSMSEIHDVFEDKLAKWQGNYRQIDDMLLIGIEI